MWVPPPCCTVRIFTEDGDHHSWIRVILATKHEKTTKVLKPISHLKKTTPKLELLTTCIAGYLPYIRETNVKKIDSEFQFAD